MENNNQNYFAIDSDILRALAFVDIILERDPNCDLKTINDPLMKRWSGYIKKLYFKIKSGEIKPVIVETVYLESKHSPSLVSFMKKYCYFPNVNAINYEEKKEKARKLAYAYCEPYKFKGEPRPAPMKTVYNAALNAYAPTNDCFIMAQATIEGIPLITANGRDYIFDERSENENDNTRVLGIASINHAEGYHEMHNGKFITVVPMHIRTIGPMLKDKVFSIETMQPLNNFVLGSVLLDNNTNHHECAQSNQGLIDSFLADLDQDKDELINPLQ